MARTVLLDETTSVSTSLHIWSCPVCGIIYGIPVAFAKECREDGRSYYCPNGHTLSWHETEADKQRKRAEKAERRASQFRDAQLQAQKEAQDAKNRARAEKAAKTRLKNRIKNGVCPCCNRHFANVERHIKSQHPEYALPPHNEGVSE